MLALGEKWVYKKSGAAYSYTPKDGPEEKLGRGYDATRQFLKDKENKNS